MSEYVPGSRAAMRLAKKNGVSEQIQNDYMHIKGQSKSITRGKQIN